MKLNKILYSFLFAALADFVLWDKSFDYGYGILLAFLYLAAVFLIVINNRFAFKSKIGLITLAVSSIGFFALLENISTLSIGMACFNLIVLSFVRLKDLDAGRLVEKVFKTLQEMGYFQYLSIVKKNVRFNKKYSVVKKCILPLLFSIIFICLFSFINPLFLTLLNHILNFIIEWVNPLRIALFLIMVSVGFVLIRNRVKNTPSIFDFKSTLPNSGEFLSYRSICVSLVIFNAIFYTHVITELYSIFFSDSATAVVSIATQAIDAAHILLFVTLLAIVFISLTSSYDKQTEKITLMRFLIIVWLIQNFILMVLGINYLDMFIKAEGLTYWRFSSVIWYGLIALGLVLTAIKIRYRKSLNWLVNWNAINVYVVFTVLCYVNISAYIAEYNIVNHHYNDSSRRGVYGHNVTSWYSSSQQCGYYERYGEDVIPALVKTDTCFSVNDQDIRRFVDNYNQSYRFWTYRRYRTVKAIENYRKARRVVSLESDFSEGQKINSVKKKVETEKMTSEQYIESGYNVTIVKNLANPSFSIALKG